MPLPRKWRGLRSEELSAVSGIPGCIFVHTNGFIGGNKTLEGALTMARKAIEIGNAQNDEETENDVVVKKMRSEQDGYPPPVQT